MIAESTLKDKLTKLRVLKPSWPEDLGSSPGWIHLAIGYKEDVQLITAQIRLQLQSQPDTVFECLEDAASCTDLSAWERDIVSYILASLQSADIWGLYKASARLVCLKVRTRMQLLAAMLILAADDHVYMAIYGAKCLLNTCQASAAECEALATLLLTSIRPLSAKEAIPPLEDSKKLLRMIEFYQCAVEFLSKAVSYRNGNISHDLLIQALIRLQCMDVRSTPALSETAGCAIQLVERIDNRLTGIKAEKPCIRTIHHLACTGGTVISKCIAAMANVALISEVNPLNRFGSAFEPTNPLLQLERSYRQLTTDEIKSDFVRQIAQAHEICRSDSVNLVLRDHSHTDFCIGSAPSGLTPIRDFLHEEYSLLSLITVRHPLDSFLSMVSQDWHTQFSPSSLDEYCCRYLAFLDRYRDLPLMRYESFCVSPHSFMRQLCDLLDLEYDSTFTVRFGCYALSGDSGRSSSSEIKIRPRRSVPIDIQKEVYLSPYYAELIERLGYIG